MIILIGGEKGGTGKTTIATNLAAMRALTDRDVLLIDTDPQGSANYWAQSRDELKVMAHKAYIPIQPSQFDIWTLNQMDELVETAIGFNPDLQAWVIISRSSTNPSVHESDDTVEILNDFSNLSLAGTGIKDRIAYRKAASSGLGVSELKPKDAKAVEEMDALYKEVFGDE